MGHIKPGRKKVRKRFAHARRVKQAQAKPVGVARGQGKAHGHAVVVVGVDGRALPLAGRHRVDAQPVLAARYRGPQRARLVGHGGDAVGFFDAPTANTGERARAIGQHGHGHQGHGGVGYGGAV